MILNCSKTEYINMHSTALLLQTHFALYVLGTTNEVKFDFVSLTDQITGDWFLMTHDTQIPRNHPYSSQIMHAFSY